ncbi:WD40 repeat domain-containing protein [Catellatospora aurea]|uniref:WD40 repeat domain-containing protein n=1 Tax=Catellatospora aurea TaxID=1337874 RepID=A0ABW2H9Z6_9ACTN
MSWGSYVLAEADVLAARDLVSVETAACLDALAVFVPGECVETDVVLAYWTGHLGLSRAAAERGHHELSLLSVISRQDEAAGVVAAAVRPAVLRYSPAALRHADEALLAAAHDGITPSGDLGEVGTPWWQLPPGSRYLYRWLCRHLRRSGRVSEAAALSREARWIHRVIAATEVGSAVGDLRHGTAADRRLAAALARSASRLEAARAHDERVLRDHPGSPAEALRDALLDLIARAQGTPPAAGTGPTPVRLSTRWSTMPQPGKALSASYALDDRPGALAFSPDGTRLAVQTTGRLSVWDLPTGRREVVSGSGPVFAPDWSWVAVRDTGGSAAVHGLGADRFTCTTGDQSVYDLAAAADGTWLATAARSGTVRIRNSHDGRLRCELADAGLHVGGGAAPDGSWLLVTRPGGGTVWDPATGRLLGTLVHERHDATFAELVARDSSWVVTCDRSGDVVLWDARTVQRRALLARDLPWPHWRIGAPDSSWLLMAGEDGVPRVWCSADGALTATLRAHRDRLTGCEVSPDGSWLATAGGDGLVRVWDTGDWRVRTVLEPRGNGAAACLVAADGSWLATRRDDHVQLWDSRDGSLRAEVDCGDRIDRWAVTADGSLLATAHEGTVRVWDTALPDPSTPDDDPDGEPGHVLAPCGPWIAVHGAAGVRVRDEASGRLLWRCSDVGDPPTWAAASDGSWLAAVDGDGMLRVRHPRTGAVLANLPTGGSRVRCCAHAAGRLAATGDDGRVRCWRTDTWQECADWDGGLGPLTACLIAPDGSWLAAGGTDCARIWDFDGELRAQLDGAVLDGAIVAASGRWIGAVDGGMVQFWDTNEGFRLDRGGWHGVLHRCVASPDEAWVGLVGLHANQYGFTADALPIRPYVEEGEFGLFTERAVELATGDVAPSPDGRWAATTDGAGPIRVWDVATWRPVAAAWADGRVRRCGWLADGTGLWVVGPRGVQVFDLAQATSGRRRSVSSPDTVEGGGSTPAGPFDGRRAWGRQRSP